ncbi:MAG: DsrE family protein [Prolixibacteraceae bacterium]
MDKLNILWTTNNKDTVIHMISMYSLGAITRGWWKEINIIVWGASAKLISEDAEIQAEVRKMMDAGIHIEGCLACSEQFGVTETLKNLGIDLRYMGEPLSNYLKTDEKMLTI